MELYRIIASNGTGPVLSDGTIIQGESFLIHDGSGTDYSNIALNPNLKLELNKAGTLSFTLPPTNAAYQSGNLKLLKTRIYVLRRNASNKWDMLWKGRIINIKYDFYQGHAYTCEGWLGILNDSLVRPDDEISGGLKMRPDQMFTKLMLLHNSQMNGGGKNFTYHTYGWPTSVDPISGVQIEFDFPEGNYENVLNYLNSNLVDNKDIAGRLWVEDSDIYYYADGTEESCGQTIEFGKNLLDLEESIEVGELYTMLIPVGKDGLKLNPTYPEDYVLNDYGVQLYGRICREFQWPDIDNVALLKSQAQARVNKAVEASLTINVSAIDLNMLDVNVEAFAVGKTVHVKSTPHGINVDVPCTGMDLDLANPAGSKYSFGFSGRKLSRFRYREVNMIRF